jgi:threonine/homoserine/homoserine lactone efflux protein
LDRPLRESYVVPHASPPAQPSTEALLTLFAIVANAVIVVVIAMVSVFAVATQAARAWTRQGGSLPIVDAALQVVLTLFVLAQNLEEVVVIPCFEN